MRGFFTEEEREALAAYYVGNLTNILDAFKIDEEGRKETLGARIKEYRYGMDVLDAMMANLHDAESEALSDPLNRGALVDIIRRWMALPNIVPSSAGLYLLEELGFHDRKEEESSLPERLNKAKDKLVLGNRMVALADRFPYLFISQQLDRVLTSDKEDLTTIMPQMEFFESLQLEDLLRGDLDFDRMRAFNRFYTSFTPSILTLQVMEGLQVPEGKVLFPILNTNFYGMRRHDFKGVVEVIPSKVADGVQSLDSRLYHTEHDGADIRNFITSMLMTPKGGHELLLDVVERLKTEDYRAFKVDVDRHRFVNVLSMLDHHAAAKLSTQQLAEGVVFPQKTLIPYIHEAAQEAYVGLTPSMAEKAAKEMTRSGYLVAFRHMRSEMGYAASTQVPSAENRKLLLFDPVKSLSMEVDPVGYWVYQVYLDIDHILREGTPLMEGGGNFHQHRQFFEKFKKDPESVDIIAKAEVIRSMRQRMQNKEMAEFIDTTLEGADYGSKAMLKGILHPAVLHYLSARASPMVLVAEINGIKPGEMFLGYPMHNCLTTLEIMRYHLSPAARINCCWLSGERVAMSYETDVRCAGMDKVRLIDSIEVGDNLLDMMRKIYENAGGNTLAEAAYIRGFVDMYLTSRLLHADEGLLILPESNDYVVKDAMKDFIEEKQGAKLVTYEGVRVYTDTQFERIPSWVDKKSLEGTFSQVDTIGFDKLTGGGVRPVRDR